MASKKANAEDEASRPLSRLLAPCITAQPIPLRGLWAPNDDHELTVKGNHAWSLQIHLDLKLAIRDCHTWSQMVQLWPRVDFQ